MGKTIYQKCEKCGKELPRNRNFFKRVKIKGTSKETYKTICRDCEENAVLEENWRDGKLKCFVCGEWLDPDQFDNHQEYTYRGNKDKRCKKCKRQQNLTARSRYSDKEKLYSILQSRWLGAKDRASKKNIPFTLTKQDLMDLWDLQEGKCAISQIPMTFEIDSGRIFTNMSVDQKNPGQGYTKENVQLICQAVNQLKSDWDMDTVLYICKSIINNYQT